MYKTEANITERALILDLLRRGDSAPRIAHDLGFTIAAVCEIRNNALKSGELKSYGENTDDTAS